MSTGHPMSARDEVLARIRAALDGDGQPDGHPAAATAVRPVTGRGAT